MLPASSTPPSMEKTPASRESSEFEFVGANNGGGGNTSSFAAAAAAGASVAVLPAVVEPPVVAREEEPEAEGTPDLFGWVRGSSSSILSKVAQRTKSSMETVITTLDPQMKEYIGSCGARGDVRVVVASDREVKVDSVKSAFRQVLGPRATVYGVAVAAEVGSTIAAQPVGFAAGRQAAQERVHFVRQRNEADREDVVIVAVENFLLEVGNDDWVDVGCLLLHNPARKLQLTAYTQPTPVESVFVDLLKEATPDSYPKRWSGFARPIGQVIEESKVATRKEWRAVLGGVPRSELIRFAAVSLAHLYRKAIVSHVKNV